MDLKAQDQTTTTARGGLAFRSTNCRPQRNRSFPRSLFGCGWPHPTRAQYALHGGNRFGGQSVRGFAHLDRGMSTTYSNVTSRVTLARFQVFRMFTFSNPCGSRFIFSPTGMYLGMGPGPRRSFRLRTRLREKKRSRRTKDKALADHSHSTTARRT